MTPDKLVEELDRTVKVPGLSNIWVPPIRNRIDMLATGIKSPVGIKVSGPDLAEIERVAGEIERAVKNVPGVTLGAGRAAHRRPLHRRRHRPRPRRALRAEHRRRAVARRRPRSAARTSARPSRACGAFRSTCATRASSATPSSSCASCRSSPSAARRSACPTWRRAHHRRPADAPERERAALRLGLRGHRAAATCGQSCTTCRRRWPRGQAAAGLLDRVVRPVRIPRAREGAPAGRRAVRRW